MISALRALFFGALLTASVTACSPAPTPIPTSTVTIEQAAQAYSAFSTSWTGEYTDVLNADAAAADADLDNVAQYARTIANAYDAFGRGIRAIAFPTAIQPTVQQELEAVDVLVALGKQLERDSSNLSIKMQLQEALARVGQRSGAVEVGLGLQH